ncbi:MAG: glycoside hydrolase family 13 protein [Bacillota bacterium]
MKKEFAIFKPTTTEFVSEVGGAKLGESFKVSIKILRGEKCEGLHFSITKDGKNDFVNIAMKKTGKDGEYDIYSCRYSPVERGIYYYTFSYFDGGYTQHITKYKNNRIEINGHYAFQLTVYPDDVKQPAMDGGVIYQIFPDRFNIGGKRHEKKGGVNRKDWGGEPYFHFVDGIMPNNDHFGGNFEGISEKIEYIKSLGVKYIYLNPVYMADSNHKYDVCDFMTVDDCFGGEEKFKAFIAKCEENGISIIMDHVFNHVGENSIYFNKSGKYGAKNGAYRNRKSEYFDWFTFKKYPTEYNCWWGIELLPEVNEKSPSYIDHICGENGVIAKYAKMGVKGFRLDVVDEIPDDVLSLITKKVREFDGAFLIGEVWEDASNKIAYDTRRKYFSDNLLDGVMNYVWKDGIIDFVREGNSAYFMQKIIDIVSNYPSHNIAQTMNMLSSHDSARILTAVAGEKQNSMTREVMAETSLSVGEIASGKELVKMAYLLSFTLPGVPSVYYGDENLMQGYTDPFNRRCMDFNIKDEDFTAFFKMLGELRKKEVFTAKELTLFELSDRSVCFERSNGSEKVFVCVNRGDALTLPKSVKDIFTGKKIKKVNKNQMVLAFE